MIKDIHIAAQYLATTAISFLEPKADDSHTNLGWQNKTLQTHSLSEINCILSLDYESFSLIWKNDFGYTNEFQLDGKTHSQIINWIRQTALKVKFQKVYEYKLHYELPYDQLLDDFVFQKPTEGEIKQLIQNRDLANESIEKTLNHYQQNTSTRIWPHHFDTGSFFMATDEIAIGLGMAVPDGIIDDFYLYVSGYKGHEGIELPNSLNIEKGNYYNDGWKGIALPVSGITTDEATAFYKQSINHYLNQ